MFTVKNTLRVKTSFPNGQSLSLLIILEIKKTLFLIIKFTRKIIYEKNHKNNTVHNQKLEQNRKYFRLFRKTFSKLKTILF